MYKSYLTNIDSFIQTHLYCMNLTNKFIYELMGIYIKMTVSSFLFYEKK